MKLQSFIILTSYLFSFFTGTSQINNLSKAVKNSIDSTYSSLIKKNKVIGTSIAIVDNGEIVYATGYGFSDLKNEIKADANTIYGIGSITKSFTALSIMQLQEEKKLKVTNSIKDYLHELAIENPFNDGNQIYINDILSHTSGLPSDVSNGFFVDNPPSISWLIKELNKQRMISPRQYKFAYSNAGYGLLGELITRVSGITYADYLKQNIFTPLNMTSSSIGYELPNTSKTYDGKKETKEPSIRDVAAGFISSNVIDLSNYINMLINNGDFNNKQIISSNSVSEMEKDQLENVLLYEPISYGYALFQDSISVKNNIKNDSTIVRLIGHGGDTHAFHADFNYIPELKVGAVVLSNSVNGPSINSASELLKLYLEKSNDMKVDLDYNTPMSYKGTMPEDDEIKGKYNFGEMLIDVNDLNKIKIKQGLSRLILTKKPDSYNYSIKAKIFGIIPVKIKDQEFKFEKLNNEIYIKLKLTENSNEYYLTKKKIAHFPVSQSWKSMYGKYELTGDVYECKECPKYAVKDLKLNLSEDDGSLKVNLKSKSAFYGTIYFDIISDSSALLGGIGRGSGDVARILENGNLYFSGFEFSKIK